MGENVLGLNQVFPIYNADGTPFNGLVLRNATFDSVVMSLGDKITGDVYYGDNTLAVTMSEYIEYKRNEDSEAVRFVLVNPPTVVREGIVSDNSELRGMTKYSFVFYHPMCAVSNFPFTDVAVSLDEQKYLSNSKTFNWIGNLFDMVAKLNKNLQGTQWVVGTNIEHYEQDGVTETSMWQKAAKIPDEPLSFDKTYVSEVLKTSYETWEIPFVVDQIAPTDARYAQGKRFLILFGTPSNEILDDQDEPYIFRFGQGVGLKNNSRTPKNNKIVTRIVGYGSENNIPFGYPQIQWFGDQTWKYTVNNDLSAEGSLPIYKGILGGRYVNLIKHPFTRKTLMPSVYRGTLFNKVSPYMPDGTPNPNFDHTIELVDYYDADDSYVNPVVEGSESVEIHQFEDIKPEFTEHSIVEISAYDGIECITIEDFETFIQGKISASNNENEKSALQNVYDNIFSDVDSISNIGGSYTFLCEYGKETEYTSGTWRSVKYTSSGVSFTYNVYNGSEPPSVDVEWDDTMDDDGNYKQSYFKMTLPQLDFDLYACASITEEMKINMRSGACIGCTFDIAVDWDDYKKNFYDSDGNFVPDGEQRDLTKYPKTNLGQVTFVVKKDLDTFGTLMPNMYQQPHSGDEFVILGISLPTTYVTNAEARLDDAAKGYMRENNVHYYEYPLKFDEYFLATHTNILSQIRNNTIVRFQYGGELPMALYVKQITIKYSGILPTYDITLTDDVEIVLNQIGQVTDDVSRMRVQVSELQKYYSENIIQAINEKLSKVVNDVCQGRITFQQGLDAIGSAIFHDELRSPDFTSGLYTGRGWRVDQLGNAEFESIRARSFLEVVELLVNRLQAQEGDTLFTDNDQIDFVQRVENEQHEVSYILSLKEKYDGYITGQKTGNIIKGIINTLAANQAGVSQYDDDDAVETDGDNTYFTSWMRVIEDRNTADTTLKTNQIRVALYGDNDTPAGKNFVPCELMTIARWGCYQDPTDNRYSAAEKLDIERRQRMFSISVTDGRVTKYTKVNKPKIENTSFGVTIGELPEFVKNYSAVRSVLDVVGEHTDWLYAQGIVVGNFIKVDINGVPEVSYIDCGAWVNGGSIPSPSPRNGIYLCNEWNDETQQYETHDVWHNNAKWRCNQHQPVVSGGTTTYYEPTDNSQYWTKLEHGAAGDSVKNVTVFKASIDNPDTPTGSTIPPTGWSTTPHASDIQETSASGDFTDASGDHAGWREANGNHEDNAFRKDVITFTTTSPNQVISIEIQASSEYGYDFIFVGNLDIDYTQRPSSMPTGRYASGTEQKIIDTVVATVGTHTIQVIYTKDGSEYENNDKGWYRVLPNNIWASVATFVNNTLSGTWSTPVRWNGDDGTSVTIVSTEIKYQVSNSGTEVPSGTWQTTIPTVDAGQYLWTRTIVTYSDGTSTTSYSVSRNGTNGTSPIIADLSNEIDSVACTNDMKTLVATNLYSKVSLHKGTTDITSASQIKYVTKPSNASLYLESSGSGTSGTSLTTSYATIGNNQYLRVKFNSNVTLNNEQNVVLMVKSDNVELQLVFTILGIKGSSVYSLVPSANVISKNTQDQYTPSVITCKSTKIDVLSGVTTENPSGATIKYTKDGVSTEYAYNTGLTAGTDFTSYVVFLLYVGGQVVDKETVNIVSDGEKGENGKDAHEVNPNILLRTIFDKGIDFVKEKWEADWNYVYIDTDTSTIIDGKKCVKINAQGTTYKDFKQNIIGSLRNGQWYTLSFNYFATAVWRTFLYPNQEGVACIDTSAGVYVDGVFVSSIGNNGGVDWPVDQNGGRHSVTFKTASSFPTSYFYIIFRAQAGNQVSICMPKLEDGKYATAYMANDDDLKGSNGVRGKVGRFFYYAGEFNVSDSTHTFVVNDAQAPYFKTGQLTFHVYNSDTNGSFTMAQMGNNFNNEPWEVMTNDFKYLITEAIFGSYAHFGSFVINGDWMISQHGKLNGSNSSSYTLFDPTTPVVGANMLYNNVDVPYNNTAFASFPLKNGIQYSFTITVSTSSTKSQFVLKNSSGTTATTYTVNQGAATLTQTITYTPTANDTFYFTLEKWSTSTTVKATITVSRSNVWEPNYAVDGRTGAVLENKTRIRGDIYRPPFVIDDSNVAAFAPLNSSGVRILNIAAVGLNVQINTTGSSDILIDLPTDASWYGAELMIINTSSSDVYIESILWGSGDASFHIYKRSGVAMFKYVVYTYNSTQTSKWIPISEIHDPYDEV